MSTALKTIVNNFTRVEPQTLLSLSKPAKGFALAQKISTLKGQGISYIKSDQIYNRMLALSDKSYHGYLQLDRNTQHWVMIDDSFVAEGGDAVVSTESNYRYLRQRQVEANNRNYRETTPYFVNGGLIMQIEGSSLPEGYTMWIYQRKKGKEETILKMVQELEKHPSQDFRLLEKCYTKEDNVVADAKVSKDWSLYCLRIIESNTDNYKWVPPQHIIESCERAIESGVFDEVVVLSPEVYNITKPMDAFLRLQQASRQTEILHDPLLCGKLKEYPDTFFLIDAWDEDQHVEGFSGSLL